MRKIKIAETDLQGNEPKYLQECIHQNWISSQGPFVEKFETSFCNFIDSKYALTTCNGTTALHLALSALGIQPGDEVLVPDLTFAATANTVIHCGATPVLLDVDMESWTLDPGEMQKAITPKTKAVIPVHLYGKPANLEKIISVAKKNQLYVIEDCAQSIGARIENRITGSFGDIGCFSFFANKIITTGEGGMVTTSNSDLYEKMLILRDHGMEKNNRYWHLYPGFNYRLTNMQAAVGLAQMERINSFLQKREKINDWYCEELKGLDEIILPKTTNGSVLWLFTFRINNELNIDRQKLQKYLINKGIETRFGFHPLHRQPPYPNAADSDFPVSNLIADTSMSLPTHTRLTRNDVAYISACIKNYIKTNQFVKNDA